MFQRIDTKILPTTVCTGLSIALGLFYISWLTYERRRSRVLKLVIYPIKSLPGVHVDNLEITSIGAKYGPWLDRSYVILNENNNIVTQRTKPKLALIEISLSRSPLIEAAIVLKAKGKNTIYLDVNEDLSNNETVEFEIWKQTTAGVLCNAQINEWLSDFIGSRVKLVKFIDQIHPFRSSSVELNGQVEKDSTLPIRYQDGDPFFITNSASIADLNRRLSNSSTRATYKNFRPNIHIQLPTAYEEDKAKHFKIGHVEFKNIKPCDRCTFTAVNPETGVKNDDLEPLKTLKTYRLLGNYTSPLFGVNLTPITYGTIQLGDSVTTDYSECIENSNKI